MDLSAELTQFYVVVVRPRRADSRGGCGQRGRRRPRLRHLFLVRRVWRRRLGWVWREVVFVGRGCVLRRPRRRRRRRHHRLLLAHDEHAAVVEPGLAARLVRRPLAVAARAREEVPRAVG